MDSKLLFNAPELRTGNAFADYVNMNRFSAMPEFWALVKYLEEKGIIDRDEFLKFLGQNLKTQAITVEHIAYQEEAERKLKDLGV